MSMSALLCDNKIKAHEVAVKRLNPDAVIPTAGSEEAAGLDLYACIESPIFIGPHQTVKIGTGIAIELPKYTFGSLFARSGLATKLGLRPANCVGVIDSDYRGEIIVAMHNDSDTAKKIEPKERIAQLIIIPYLPYAFYEMEELSDTKRGEGGFGSSGMK